MSLDIKCKGNHIFRRNLQNIKTLNTKEKLVSDPEGCNKCKKTSKEIYECIKCQYVICRSCQEKDLQIRVNQTFSQSSWYRYQILGSFGVIVVSTLSIIFQSYALIIWDFMKIGIELTIWLKLSVILFSVLLIYRGCMKF